MIIVCTLIMLLNLLFTPIGVEENPYQKRNSVIAGSAFSLEIRKNGDLYASGAYPGADYSEETGLKRVRLLSKVKSVVTNNNNIFAIKDDNSLLSWGTDNAEGQLGNGTDEAQDHPYKVMNKVAMCALGERHTLAVKKDHTLWGWGDNSEGQLGVGDDENSAVPMHIMNDVYAAAAGYDYSLAIKNDGSLWAWGNNSDGQLGVGNKLSSNTPIFVMNDVKYVTAGYSHCMAIKQDESLWTWGGNSSGELGNGSFEESLVPIKVMDDVKYTISNGSFCLALKTSGLLYTWGDNSCRQLGRDESVMEDPTPKPMMSDVAAIAAGDMHALAIKKDGTLWAWGDNSWGQIGINAGNYLRDDLARPQSAADSDIPMINDGPSPLANTLPVLIMKDVVAIDVDQLYSVAKKADASLWIWGMHDGRNILSIPTCID